MSYLLLVMMLVLCFAGLFLAGCQRGGVDGADAVETSETPEPAVVVTADTQTMTRTELRQRLRALAAKPKPTKLSPGAMCYKPAGPPDRVEYACPVCGERTVYVRSERTRSEIWLLSRDLTACRRLVKQIKGLDIKLDESLFCRKCKPDAEDQTLVLEVQHPGAQGPHRVSGVRSGDLQLLREFMAGETKHVGSTDHETPLVDSMERLEELLGVKMKESK